MMVLGEPGIGKTALCEQLATYVTLRGGRTLMGHCYEEGSLSLPYLAFVEAMRSYVLSREVKELRAELGTGATDVARIVSEIRERLKVRLRPQKDPEEERYRLMQAVTGFLTNAAAVQPLLVVLEDLHDADKGTLDMLTHVSRNLSGARLLIVGTYRDVEVDRTHPLSAALAELKRVSTFGRVVLRGLNADEVRRMLDSITRESVPWTLAEAVHRQTEGNPLFVQEVVRYLNEEGLIKREAGQWKGKSGTSLEMNIPEGLRDVIGKRISLLSNECNELLSVASVIGREFAIEALKVVAKMNEDAFVNALKEAVRLSVLEERSQVGLVRYRFTHAFFRQTLYEEMIAPQRLKLHQQVARALETLYARHLDEHAAELAEHFSHSTDAADLKKAVNYGEMAAGRAMDVYAYRDAVSLLEQGVKVQEILDPEDKAKRCDLLLGLCNALVYALEARRVLDKEAPDALGLAEAIGDGRRACRACMLAVLALNCLETINAMSTPEAARWVEKLDHYAQPGTAERAWADFAKAMVIASSQERVRLFMEGMALARRLGDADALPMAMPFLFYCPPAEEYVQQALQLADELLAQSGKRGGIMAQPRLWSICNAGQLFLAVGQRERGEQCWRDFEQAARRSQSPEMELISMLLEALLFLMDGKFEETLEMSRKLLSRGNELGVPVIASVFEGYFSPRLNFYLGKAEESLSAQDHRTILAGPPFGPMERGVILAHSGRQAEVAQLLGEYVAQHAGPSKGFDPWSVYVGWLEAAVLVRHSRAAEVLLAVLGGTPFRTTGYFYPTCVARHLGGAAALLGRYDEARQHYQEAIRVCTEMRFRPELALTRLQLAELLLDHYPAEKKDAIEDLDFAIKEFREMKMRPSLERALRHKEILKA